MPEHSGHIVPHGPHTMTLIMCEQCGFIHQSPLPDEAAQDALYRERYYEEVKPDYLDHAEEDAGWWALVHDERVALLEYWLNADPRMPKGIKRTVLDVGSGPGAFLQAAELRGWEGVGLEPNRTAWDYSARKGLTVFNQSFDDDAARQWRGFHAVHMSEVLEHVSDAEAMVRRVHDALLPGGLFLVVVPNDFNMIHDALLKHRDAMPAYLPSEPWWIVPEHVNYFSATTLHALVRRCGFAVADLTCTFPMEFFLLSGMQYVGNPDVGRVAHGMRKSFELVSEGLELGHVRRQLYRSLARHGLGRDIVMLCRKPSIRDAAVDDSSTRH